MNNFLRSQTIVANNLGASSPFRKLSRINEIICFIWNANRLFIYWVVPMRHLSDNTSNCICNTEVQKQEVIFLVVLSFTILQNKAAIRTQVYIIICSAWWESNIFSSCSANSVQPTHAPFHLSQVTDRSQRRISETKGQIWMAGFTLYSYKNINIKL